jgi:hypothetical protein
LSKEENIDQAADDLIKALEFVARKNNLTVSGVGLLLRVVLHVWDHVLLGPVNSDTVGRFVDKFR